jgi:hypothetical protein
MALIPSVGDSSLPAFSSVFLITAFSSVFLIKSSLESVICVTVSFVIARFGFAAAASLAAAASPAAEDYSESEEYDNCQ